MAAYDPSQYKPSRAGTQYQPSQSDTPRETFAGKVTGSLQKTALFKPSEQAKSDQLSLKLLEGRSTTPSIFQN